MNLLGNRLRRKGAIDEFLKNKSGSALAASAIGSHLHAYPKPAYAGSRKADDGRLWVFVATNLFGNIAVPEFIS